MTNTQNTQEETNIPKNEQLHRAAYDPREGHTLPTHGDYARTLTIASHQGILSTVDRKDQTPYGSIVELLPLEDGNFVFFVSNMADHTKNLNRNAQCSLLIAEGFGQGYALALSRATYMGKATKVEGDLSELKARYLELHPEAKIYINFPDFNFYKLVVERVRYIGGFGRMSWVPQEMYQQGEADPLWEDADRIIDHMNEDHTQNMEDYAHYLNDVEGEIDEIQMTCVDRFGFEMRVRQGTKGQTIRMSFSKEVQTSVEVRQEMVALAHKAREEKAKRSE